MLHELRLNEGPFESISAGTKTIEMRLNDEKRRKIHVGDKIKFSLRDDETKSFLCDVVDKVVYDNFEELYLDYDKEELGYKPNEEARPEDMEQYYSKEDIEKYGVVAIEVELC